MTDFSSETDILDKFSQPKRTRPSEVIRGFLLKEVERHASKIRDAQGQYQPLYGVDYGQENKREELLTSSCRLVLRHFDKVKSKQQVRIVDVGCNVGFVTMTLAETFPLTLGLEINSDCLEMAKLLSEVSGSQAAFDDFNLFEAVEGKAEGIENIDCALLLNVVHQFIFNYGLDRVRQFFKNISQIVDVLLVELATQEDYIPHKKDQLLPLDVEEVFADVEGADIELIRSTPRPLYLVRRRVIAVGDARIPFSNVAFSEHENPGLSRKYYLSPTVFVKEFRFSNAQGPSAVKQEVEALLKLRGEPFAPRLLEHDIGSRSGRIAMTRIYGRSILSLLGKIRKADEPKIVQSIVRVAAGLARHGICHNDFSAHNMILKSDMSIVLIDFEHSSSVSLNDAFGFFLWIVHDILVGSPVSYHLNVFGALESERGERADRSSYPDMSEHHGHPSLGAIITDAETTKSSFAEFAMKWASA